MFSFNKLSETLRFDAPELCTTRTQILDYFDAMEKVVDKDHMIFSFEEKTTFSDPELRLVDQLCVQIGFPRGNGCEDFEDTPKKGP